ncbi:SMP-30/gluconolactonase/LRE family protein [uncultured Marinobacter sp.]|uniref:SMP-30/gluconolactonase/LRE family protein n=1 Tax=uncultured Marinobacter sp. TaxID=187379 RepID=UPI0030DDBB2D
MAELNLLVDGGSFFEGPRWRDGQWWVSDFYQYGVFTVSPEGERTKILDAPEQSSGLGWLPDGSLVYVSMLDQKVMRRATDGTISEYADISAHTGGHANDLVAANDGNLWVGNFGFDLMEGGDLKPAKLVRIDPQGKVSVAADDLFFPNGMVITPDQKTLIVGETFGNRMTAFTIADDGELYDRRDWASFGDKPKAGPRSELLKQLSIGPDGCGLDAEGQIWIADAFNQRCIRVAEGGEITDEIAAPPGQGVFACILGGDDGRTLLMCCAPDSAAKRRKLANEACLYTARVAVPHAGNP